MYSFVRTLLFKKKLNAFEQFFVFVKGTLLGMLMFVPGLGLPTISLALNIHKECFELLHVIHSLINDILHLFKGNFKFKVFSRDLENLISDFSLPLFIGFIFGIPIFTFIFSFTLDNAPAYIRAVFFGLILGSFLIPIKQVKKVRPNHKVWFLIIFILFFYIFGFNSTNIFYAPSYFMIFITGFLSPLTLVMPGLGATFFMVLFNNYHHFLEVLYKAVYSNLTYSEYLEIIVFVFSYILGFVFVIKAFFIIIKKYKEYLMICLSAIMLASLRLVYPFITIKGDTIINLKPFDLPFGQTLMLILIVFISFMITKMLNNKHYLLNKVINYFRG